MANNGQRTKGPGVKGELWSASASELAMGVAAGEFSSREVVESCLGRIDAVNGEINAIVEVHAEEALSAADQADRKVAAGEELGPLHGVPVTTKINSDQAGKATTDGVVALKDNIAAVDSPQVGGLLRAGGISVGRTNTPAFSYRWFTENDLHGKTLNPWSAGHTPGGSSGGASAATAAGLAPICHGNDLGGSIRYPAHACGVVGLRPTIGRVANNHRHADQDVPLSVELFGVDGPLARTVPDIRLAMEAMTAPDPRDAIHVPGAPAAVPAATPTRVALVRDVGAAAPTPEVNAALDQAAAWLGDAGYIVEEAAVPALEEAWKLWWLLCLEEFRLVMPLVDQVGDEGMKECARGYYAAAAEWHGEKPTLEQLMRGYARRSTLIEMLSVFMDDNPIVLLPISAEPVFEQDLDQRGVETVRRMVAAQWSQMAIPIFGSPAIAVPTGVANGLPMGVQLLGRRFGEEDILTAAEAIEAQAGVITPVDPFSGSGA